MSDLISIIVAVYNEEEYLERCLDSIIGQSYRNLEILVVNDGSTDRSPRICDRYALRDARIRVFHISKSGLSAARNTGLEHAGGSYIGFVDSDDRIEADMFEKMHRAVTASGCDLSMCGFIKEEKGHILSTHVCREEMVIGGGTFLEMFFAKRASCMVWNKLFRAELIKDLRFPEGHNFEDLWILPRLLDREPKICVVPEPLYHYEMHDSSIVHSRSYRNILDSVYSKEALVKYARRKFPELDRAAAEYLLKVYVAHWYLLSGVDIGRGRSSSGKSAVRRRQERIRKKALRLLNRYGAPEVSGAKRASILMMEHCPVAAGCLYLGASLICKQIRQIIR